MIRRTGAKLDAGDMLAHLDAQELSTYDMPEYLLDLDHIPLTPSGKIRTRDIVEAIARWRAAPQPARAAGKAARR